MMTIIPTPDGHPQAVAMSPQVHAAINALNSISGGSTILRDQAADMLPGLAGYDELTADERTQILYHYPTAADLAALAQLAHRTRDGGTR